MPAQEGCRIGQKMRVIALVFANWTILVLGEELIVLTVFNIWR